MVEGHTQKERVLILLANHSLNQNTSRCNVNVVGNFTLRYRHIIRGDVEITTLKLVYMSVKNAINIVVILVNIQQNTESHRYVGYRDYPLIGDHVNNPI